MWVAVYTEALPARTIAVTDHPLDPPRKGAPLPGDLIPRIDSGTPVHEMRDPYDIGETLSMLADTGGPLTIYPADPAEPMLCRVASVHPEEPHFTLDIAEGAAIPAGRATFVAALAGNARLQFDLESDWAALPGPPHLVPAVFPDTCLVLNRRAAPRLDTPVNGNYIATFSMLNKAFEMPLCDYSTSGVGLRATPEQADELYVGRKLRSVHLQLGPALTIVADLEIRLLRPFRSFLLGEQVQVGCAISNIEMQMQQTLERLVTTNRGRTAA